MIDESQTAHATPGENMKPASIATFIAVTVIGLISTRTPLHAQSPSDTIAIEDNAKPWSLGVPTATRQAAQDLFLEGNRLFKIPLFARAAEQYTAALSQWKHPAFYFNLALAQLNLGQEVEARNNFEQALKHGEQPLGAERFQVGQKQLQDLERRLGRIHVSCQTEGAEVTLDGVSLFTGPGSYEGWVKAKAHEITAKRPDYLAEARRVAVSAGELKSLDLKLITLSEAAESGRRWVTWKPWVVVAAGGAVAVSAGVLHALSAKNFRTYDDEFRKLDCATMPDLKNPGCTEAAIGPNLSSQLHTAMREQQIAVGGYIVGGSLVATGIVLLYLNRPRLLEQPPTSSYGGSVVVVPTVSPDVLGILVSVSH